ncbi:MAG: energy transducer TonB [Flavobacterium sp.]
MNKLLQIFVLGCSFAASAQSTIITSEAIVGQEKVYNFAEVTSPPEYPGGIDAFRKYVMTHIRVPDADEDVVAKLLVSFVIDFDGCITNINVKRSPGYGLEEEVKRVLLYAKPWKVAIFKDKPVKTSYALPISINILGNGTEEKKE